MKALDSVEGSPTKKYVVIVVLYTGGVEEARERGAVRVEVETGRERVLVEVEVGKEGGGGKVRSE